MVKLSDQELQEVQSCLNEGRPLPDKYRFLLFGSKRQVELVWDGKTDKVCDEVVPFELLERFQGRGDPPTKGWTNKLIWGDNKLILSSLKNGPLRHAIEAQGGLKLIYIDPPFDVGADFSMDIGIGEDTFTKKPNILEEIAYRDTWGKGADSFLAMIFERLSLMRDLLAKDGSIYIHCDWRVNSSVRQILDELFGFKNHVNEISWCYSIGGKGTDRFGRKHDTIFMYSNGGTRTFNARDKHVLTPRKANSHMRAKVDSEGRQYQEKTDAKSGKVYRYYIDEGAIPNDYWTDIEQLNWEAAERLGYDTQKPERLIARIIAASSNPGDLIADFFCGSGTTAAVAEKLGRKWIAADLGKFAIHTTRKRMIGVQRQLKDEGKDFRAFEILNLGRYERSHYIGVNPNLREEEQQAQLRQNEVDFLALILKAYQAEPVSGFGCFQGKRAGRVVAIGPINLPISRLVVEEIILECRKQHITKVDLLGFEFEMGLFPNVLDDARSKGIDIAPKYIPAEVFDKRAVDRNQVVFHNVAYIEAKPIIKDKTLAVQLTNFSILCTQDVPHPATALSIGRKSKVKPVIQNGQLMRLSKGGDRELLTKYWSDWIDYWAVDFSYDGLVFNSEWQSFRSRKGRKLELTTDFYEVCSGGYSISVKVIDVLGNEIVSVLTVGN